MTINTSFSPKVALLCLFFSFSVAAQDCSTAIQLTQPFYKCLGLDGYGQHLEFFGNARTDKNYIESEHNTIWYKFTATRDCELELVITPVIASDDYDFMLFRYEDETSYCQQITSKKLLPVRSNMSRNNQRNAGMTGLKTGERETHYPEGPGTGFSKSLTVRAGEKFVLVVDNVSGKGGHTLTLTDCIAPAPQEKPTYVHKYLETKTDEEKFNRFTDDLAKGESIVLDAVYFFGNSSVAMTTSKKQLDDLVSFMKRNPKVTITVHGHTNGRAPNTYYFPKDFRTKLFADNDEQAYDPQNAVPFRGSAEKLSLFRARTVKAYLMLQGIEESRIETIGWGDTKMKTGVLDPDSYLNRRVEIEITSK